MARRWTAADYRVILLALEELIEECEMVEQSDTVGFHNWARRRLRDADRAIALVREIGEKRGLVR